MLLNELMEHCGATKKAIEYYEKQGLLSPAHRGNGYRDFTARDCSLLKKITLLRRLGAAISDIREILFGENQRAALAACLSKKDAQLRQAQVQRDCLALLLTGEPENDRLFDEIEKKLECGATVREKLEQAFPGNFGLLVSVHFGKFLDCKIDTPEKLQAYYAIVDFLDGVAAFEIPPALQTLLADTFRSFDQATLEKLDSAVAKELEDPLRYFEEHAGDVRQWIDYQKSDAFRASPAGELKRLLLEFQSAIGYPAFLENMQIISDSYRAYITRANASNARILALFPDAQGLSVP